jgi:hypothetical protein
MAGMGAPGLPSEATVTEAQARDAVAEACPTTRIVSIESTTLGYTSRQGLARTDEGDLLVKFPARNPDPERTRAMIYATRLASEVGVPVVRFQAFLPESRHLHPGGRARVRRRRACERRLAGPRRGPAVPPRRIVRCRRWPALRGAAVSDARRRRPGSD